MKRITLWVLSTVTTVVLLFGYHTSTSGPMASTTLAPIEASASSGSSSTRSDTGSTGSGSGSDPTTQSSPSTTASQSSTVTGDVAMTRWGPVQVELTIAGGSITDVSVVQYPSGNREDEQINSYALPILTQQTIDTQSANIDMISGATVTSMGYLESLQSALDQAGL